MIVGDPALVEAALEPGAVEDRGVRRDVGAEQVECDAVVEVEIALQGRQVDHAVPAHFGGIADPVLRHHLRGPLQDARDPRLADEHVMRFLGQHEARGSRQRVERALRQRAELELAVAVGEKCEHEKSEPVRRPFVERAEDSRIVAIARAPLE